MVKALLILLYVLLGIIGLVLALVLLVLLVPIRYSVYGAFYEKVSFEAKVSWLLRLFSFSVSKGEEKLLMTVSIFGIKKSLGGEKKEKEKEEEKPPEEPEEKEKKKKKGSVQKIIDLVTDPRFGGAVEKALLKVARMLRHILPKDLAGDVTFGADDPSATGKAAAIAGALLPVHREKIKFTPDFSREVKEGWLRMKGRISLIVLLVLALGILFDRNVLFVIKTLKNMNKDTEVENV